MTEEKWQGLLIKLEDSFDILDHDRQPGEVEGEFIEYIEWQMPDKQMRAEAHWKPKLVAKKTMYSKRIGSQTSEQHIYSNEDKVFFVNFYERFDDNDDWHEVGLTDFA